jgi:NTE family protein
MRDCQRFLDRVVPLWSDSSRISAHTAESGDRMLSPRSQHALFTLPAFRGLGVAERTEVAGFFHEIVLEKDAVIYRAGDDADALYLLASGAVDVLDGAEVIARYGPGEVFGEAALLAGEPRAVTTRVALDALLLVLPRDSIDRLLELHPSLHQRVSALLARRLKQAVQAATGRRKARQGEIVVLQGWRSAVDGTEFALDLAGALEHELGAAVAIVTVTSSATHPTVGARRDRPDAVVIGEVPDGCALRARVASELALRAAQAPVVLVLLDDTRAAFERDLVPLGDTILYRIDGLPLFQRETVSRRVVLVHDRRTGTGTGPAVSGNDVVSLPIDDAGRSRTLGRLARHLTHRSVGLALGSGAAWGLAHIGVLDVFEREGIPIDAIAGASMGAIVGAHYAVGFSPARLAEIATGVRDIPAFIRILPRLLYLAVDFNVRRPGLFAGDHFQRVLDSLGPIEGRTFADLEIPFRAVATDIATGARVELTDGDLCIAMRASFSAPWIFSPFRIGEHILIDGGMSDPVPAETARSMGADLVIGVNVVPPVFPQAQNPLEVALRALARVNPLAVSADARLPSSFDVVVRTLQIMQHELGNNRAAEADLLIRPDLRDYWVLEFWKAASLIEQGRRAARAELPAIREKLDELRGEGT